jgi:hypothetical protein
VKLALLARALLLTLAACAPEATPTPSPAAQALRACAEAYALARTEARFDDT